MMNPVPRKLFLLASAAAAVMLVVDAVTYRRDLKRQENQRQVLLDIEAIQLATDVVVKRLDDPEYLRKGFPHAMEDLNHEIEFQKIALRTDI